MRYYLVSDIHSYYTQFTAALTEAGYFEDEGEKRLVILGDLFDRGPEPLELMDFILERLDSEKLILIRGNHEDLFIKLCTVDEGRCTHQHYVNGTYATALALTGMSEDEASADPAALAKAGLKTKLVTEIIPRMKNYHETRSYVFTHGWLPCACDQNGNNILLSSWRRSGKILWEAARWINGMNAAQQGAVIAGKTVVCGHYNASWGHCNIENACPEFGEGADSSPYYAEGIIAIDACTAASGRVNCIVIEDEELFVR